MAIGGVEAQRLLMKYAPCPLLCRSQAVLLLALILEGDFHLSAVGHHLTIFNHQILIDNLGNSQFT